MRHSLSRSQTQQLVALRARQTRSALTPSEQLLWSAISACKLGVWFRRQVPIGNFIADFVAPAIRLIVEVDGTYHRRRQAADARRDLKLQRLGFRVLRLDASLVEHRLELAIARVCAAIHDCTPP